MSMTNDEHSELLRKTYEPHDLQQMTVEELQQAIETVRTEMRKQKENEHYLQMFGYFTDLTVRLEFKLLSNGEEKI